MRRTPVALALVVVALTVAACGGSGKSSSDTSGTEVASDNGNAAGILSAIDTQAVTGPQKLKLDLTVDIKGSPTDAQLAVFTKKPINSVSRASSMPRARVAMSS